MPQALNTLFISLLNKGDEVLIVEPYFPWYPSTTRLCGATPVYVSTSIEGRFWPTVEEIEAKVTAKSKLLIFSNGAYGDRMAKVCEIYGINHDVIRTGDRDVPKVSEAVARVTQVSATAGLGFVISAHESREGLLRGSGSSGGGGGGGASECRAARVSRRVHFGIDGMPACVGW